MKKYLNDLSFKDLVATFYDKTEIHFANGLNQQRFLGKKSWDFFLIIPGKIIPLKLRATLAAHSRTQMCQVCTVSGQCTAANSMDPIHFGLNMHCIFKDVDVNFLESFKGLYFLHCPHFPLPCCVLSSPHTMLANHVFWTVYVSHLLLLQKTEISQCCAAVSMYILYPFIPSLVSPAQQSPYHTTQYEGAAPLHHPTGWQDRVPEVYIQQWAQPHLFHNFTIMALHAANCPISRNHHYTTKQQGITLPQ